MVRKNFDGSYLMPSLRNANEKIRQAIENANRAVHQMENSTAI